jgi:hypothetical protein
MANDYQGDPTEFAIVIPTPVVLKETQVNVAEPALIDHLDAYTAPRLVEYFDGNPCQLRMMARRSMVQDSAAPCAAESVKSRASALGVKIEVE